MKCRISRMDYFYGAVVSHLLYEEQPGLSHQFFFFHTSWGNSSLFYPFRINLISTKAHWKTVSVATFPLVVLCIVAVWESVVDKVHRSST